MTRRLCTALTPLPQLHLELIAKAEEADSDDRKHMAEVQKLRGVISDHKFLHAHKYVSARSPLARCVVR